MSYIYKVSHLCDLNKPLWYVSKYHAHLAIEIDHPNYEAMIKAGYAVSPPTVEKIPTPTSAEEVVALCNTYGER